MLQEEKLHKQQFGKTIQGFACQIEPFDGEEKELVNGSPYRPACHEHFVDSNAGHTQASILITARNLML